MEKESGKFLDELLEHLVKLGKDLEESYNSDNIEKFEQTKKIMIESEKKILKTLE